MRWLTILMRITVRLVPEYIVLVLLLGAARAWLFPHAGPEIGNTIWWIMAFAVAGTLFVSPTAVKCRLFRRCWRSVSVPVPPRHC